MIHNITYRTFIHGTENEDKVLEALLNVLPLAKAEKSYIEGHFNNQITILKGKISKKRDVKESISNINSLANKSEILADLDRKMDKNGNLFLRFSKQSALNEELKIIDGSDAIHLKIKIAAYPAKKHVAMNLAKEIFSL
ncbi:MAG: RNA-binding domain-containing protein [Methanobacteriaceae archaeon]